MYSRKLIFQVNYQAHSVNTIQNFQREDQNTAKENKKEMNLMKEMQEHG